MKGLQRIKEATAILKALGLPRQQLNDRSALTLLALLDMRPGTKWAEAGNPLMGITPIMEFAATNYGKAYAPNTRETIRRQTMHQFMEAGLALYNPDESARPINSPRAVYQIAPEALAMLQVYKTKAWAESLATYLTTYKGLAAQYALAREMNLVAVQMLTEEPLLLSPGAHSLLIKAIIEDFGPRFAPNGLLLYAGDTGEKFAYMDANGLSNLGITLDSHGKMPDVIIYLESRNWILLIESVTSHGPVDGKRHKELSSLFAGCKAGLVFVTAFPSRVMMAKYVSLIAWETEVWAADAPTHLIHFNGDRFLGPYLS